MRNLGIDIDNPHCNGMVSNEEAAQWRYVHHTLLQHKQMLANVADSYTKVISLRETKMNQIATQQAKEVSRLTKVAVLFIPVSVLSGIMSMGGSFLPGEKHFWVFWAFVVPIIAFVCIGLLTDFEPLAWLRHKDISFSFLGTKNESTAGRPTSNSPSHHGIQGLMEEGIGRTPEASNGLSGKHEYTAAN